MTNSEHAADPLVSLYKALVADIPKPNDDLVKDILDLITKASVTVETSTTKIVKPMNLPTLMEVLRSDNEVIAAVRYLQNQEVIVFDGSKNRFTIKEPVVHSEPEPAANS